LSTEEYRAWGGTYTRRSTTIADPSSHLTRTSLAIMASFATCFALPLVVFPSITALAYKFIFGHLVQSGLREKIARQCSPALASLEVTPYRLNYTGFGSVDQNACTLVSIFHAAMSPAPSLFTNYFIWTLTPVVAISSIESCRNGRHFSLAVPVLFTLTMQVMSFGAVMPLYWLLFIWTGTAGLRAQGERTKVPQAQAEAIIFGIFIGFVVPTLCMLALEDPYVTAMWQLFPAWQALAQRVHLFGRPVSRHPESGYRTLRALYIAIFILSSSIHLSVVAPRVHDFSSLKRIFVPSISVLPSDTALELQVLDFLQFDAVFGFLSSLLATLWFGHTGKEVMGLTVWALLGSILFGPGAAITGAALWRESRLDGFAGESKSK